MTLTFDLATGFLFETHYLVMMVICAKLFSNPTMHNKLIDRARTGFTEVSAQSLSADWGWSGGAMLLGKLLVPGRPTIWIAVGQGPTALAVGAGGGCLDIFILIYHFFPLSPSLWETARYRLKYCLKGPLYPKPTNQPKVRTVTFDLATWFLFATHYLIMMIICAKLFLNPTLHNTWVGHEQVSLKSMHKI